MFEYDIPRLGKRIDVVLLARAKKGMALCVPKVDWYRTASGFPRDGTRLSEFYDGTFEYLMGFEVIC